MEEHLSGLGLPRSTFAPPFYRALWRLGIEAPPPLFTGLVPLALIMGTLFALMWGPFLWIAFRVLHRLAPSAVLAVPALFIVPVALVAGALFGFAMAGLIRRTARKLRLPSWSEYSGCPERGEQL